MKQAWQSFRSRPAPALAAVGILVVGIGLATAVFASGDPYLLKPLPYKEPDRLAAIEILMPSVGRPGTEQNTVPALADWQARTDLFEGLAAFNRGSLLRAQLADRTVPLHAMAVSSNLLSVLGLEGGNMTSTADADAVWLSTRAAAQASDGRLSPGRLVPLLPAGAVRVNGVLPRTFLFPQANRRDPVDALVVLPPGPVVTIRQSSRSTSSESLHLVGRLRQGITASEVEAALNAGLAGSGFRVSVVPLQQAMTSRLHALALGAMLASAFVLLVCCANVAGIALTRGLHRAGELATLDMLGATSRRIAGLLATEGGLIATLGTAGGLGLAALVLPAAAAAMPDAFITLGTPDVTGRVIAFAALGGLIAFAAWSGGSIAAWQLGARSRQRTTLSRDRRSVRAIRFSLLAGQVAAAFVLLAGAGLMGRSYSNLMQVDAGVDERSIALSVSYPPDISPDQHRQTLDRTVEALRRVPGVRAAAASSLSGLVDDTSGAMAVLVAGRPVNDHATMVTPDYFAAVGLTFVAGRPPGPADPPQSVVINESFASRYFAGRDPVGEPLFANGPATVIGVVKDMRQRGLSHAPQPSVFVPMRTLSSVVPVTYIVGVSEPAAARTNWTQVVQRVEPSAIVLDGTSLNERLHRSIQDRSFAALVIALFAMATLAVTAAGLTGVVSYVVARRTHEIGIRLALGARPAVVTWLVMRDALFAAACGGAGGLVAASWLSRAIESLLYDVAPGDPTTLVLTTVGVVALAVGAAALPARRAGRLSPAIALRVD